MGERFGRCFQLTGQPWFKGTQEQQTAVREAFTPVFDSPFDKLLYRLDVAVNKTGRHYLTVEFHSNMKVPGISSPAGISLSGAMNGTGVKEMARHEFGHLTDFYNLLTGQDRVWFMREMGRESWPGAWESWAEAVREWCESDGNVWKALTPILLPD